MTSLVSVKNLSFYRKHAVIFDGINLEIEQGKITAIMGPSGTGKTTLLKLIGGQLRPTQGVIEISGSNVHDLNRKDLFALRRNIGMLFQSSALFTDLTVYENVAFPLRIHTKLPDTMIRDLVLMKLEAVGLRGAKNLMPSELSGGMARRVALARAVILDPTLIMYDEPFTGLDPIAKGMILKLIRDFNAALGATTVLVSHDVQEAASIADYIYILSEHHIIGEGKQDEVACNDNVEVNQFMHGLPDGAIAFHYPAEDYYSELFASWRDETKG